jgi:ATP-dependent DNA helicase PIF1
MTRPQYQHLVKLVQIKPGEPVVFLGDLGGEYLKLAAQDSEKLEDKLPAPYVLRLKQGAQVMTLKNDSGKRYVNGSLGVVKTLEPELKISVNNHTITMEKETWEEVDYKLRDDGEIVTEKKNSFTQYPLSLAYAMTIHKSQGKSFDRVTVDIGNGAFAPGQVYVALSRSTSLEGLVLNNPIQDKDIFVDERVVAYYRTKTDSTFHVLPRNRTPGRGRAGHHPTRCRQRAAGEDRVR